MEKVLCIYSTGTSILGIGKIIKCMGKVRWIIKMAKDMKANGEIKKKMEKVLFIIQTATSILVIGKIIRCMGKVQCIIKMAKNMKVNG